MSPGHRVRARRPIALEPPRAQPAPRTQVRRVRATLRHGHRTAAACPASGAGFTVVASSSSAVTHQWQHEPAPGTWTNFVEGDNPDLAFAAGVATPSLALSNLGPLASRRVRCVVSNACGSAASLPASLTLKTQDYNQDGNADQADLAYLIGVVGGEPNTSAIDPDLNADGNVDQSDVAALLDWIAGGLCP